MKYLEELTIGECFSNNGSNFILTTDFRRNGQKLCINLKDGFLKWLNGDTLVEQIDIFTFDKDNNVIAMKERKKENVTD